MSSSPAKLFGRSVGEKTKGRMDLQQKSKSDTGAKATICKRRVEIIEMKERHTKVLHFETNVHFGT